MKFLLLLFMTICMSFPLFSTMRTFYLWDDYNQFFSDEGTNYDLTIQLGDTIQWIPLGTSTINHTVTSTFIPTDAISFDYQWNPPSEVYFEYVATVLGLHEFECSIHAFVFNMVGSFNVLDDIVGMDELIYSYKPPYPNPVKNNLNFADDFTGKHYELYNSCGQAISQGIIRQGIDLSSLKAGMYVLIVFFKEPKRFQLVKE